MSAIRVHWVEYVPGNGLSHKVKRNVYTAWLMACWCLLFLLFFGRWWLLLPMGLSVAGLAWGKIVGADRELDGVQARDIYKNGWEGGYDEAVRDHFDDRREMQREDWGDGR